MGKKRAGMSTADAWKRARERQEQQERWDRCMGYLRSNSDMPAAIAAAGRDGFGCNVSVWITALGKLLEGGERPGGRLA